MNCASFQRFALGMLLSVWCIGQCLSAVRSPSPQRLPVPGRASTSPVQACRSSRASCWWLPSACAFYSLSATATQDHCKICWTVVRRRELPSSAGVIPEMLRRLDKFDFATHSTEHVEECA